MKLHPDLGFTGEGHPASGLGTACGAAWGADQLQITPLSCAPLSPGALHSMLGAMDKRVSEEVTVPSLQCGLLKASMSHSSSGCLLVFSAHRIGRGEITQPQFSACTACIKTTIKCIESFLD